MSDTGSPSREHSQHCHRSNPSNKSSSSLASPSTASRASRFAHPPEYHSHWASSMPHGRSHHRRRDASSARTHSSSSSGAGFPEEHWPFSVRDIEYLDPIIDKHLDHLAQMVAAVEKTEDIIDRYEDDMEDMNWQVFLLRTGACWPRPGAEEEAWVLNPDAIVRDWKEAAKLKYRACRYLEKQEAICSDGVGILFKLLSERNRRRHVGRGKRREDGGEMPSSEAYVDGQ